MSATQPKHSAPWRRLWPWLLLSIGLHAMLLLRFDAARLSPVGPAQPFKMRLMPAQRAAAPAAESPPPAAMPLPRVAPGRAPASAPSAEMPNSLARAAADVQEAPNEPSLLGADRVRALPDILPPTAEMAGIESPRSLHWRYELHVGARRGEAELLWLQDGPRYRLELSRRLDGRELPQWRSAGLLDVRGLQPLRFELWRRGKVWQALSVEPETGLARFSHLRGAVAVPELTQDRLSWVLQLVSSLNAMRERRPAEFWVGFSVLGWDGRLQQWQVSAGRHETFQLPDGRSVELLLLQPRIDPPTGQQVELWLDPLREYMPLRIRFRFEDEERWEMRWVGELPPPSPPASDVN